jgi:hypothetical protein
MGRRGLLKHAYAVIPAPLDIVGKVPKLEHSKMALTVLDIVLL